MESATDDKWLSVDIEGAQRLLTLLTQGASHATVRQKKETILNALRDFISKAADSTPNGQVAGGAGGGLVLYTPQATQRGQGGSPAVVIPAAAPATSASGSAAHVSLKRAAERDSTLDQPVKRHTATSSFQVCGGAETEEQRMAHAEHLCSINKLLGEQVELQKELNRLEDARGT